MQEYELEEIYQVINIKIEANKAYEIIHSRSYGDVLFSLAENYNHK